MEGWNGRSLPPEREHREREREREREGDRHIGGTKEKDGGILRMSDEYVAPCRERKMRNTLLWTSA